MSPAPQAYDSSTGGNSGFRRALHCQGGRSADLSDNIVESFLALNVSGIITTLNKNAERWFGITASDALDRHYAEVLSAQQSADFERVMLAALKARKAITRERQSSAQPRRWIECRCQPVAKGVFVFLKDVSRQRVKQAAGERCQALLQATVDALPSQVAILDASGRIISVNASWMAFGARHGNSDPRRGVGQNYLALCKDAAPGSSDAEKVYKGLGAVLAGHVNEYCADYCCELGGEAIHFQLEARRYSVEDASYVMVCHEDVSAAKRSERSLRRLADQLLTAQDMARRDIARELHDSTAQNLLCAALVVKRAASSGSDLTEEARVCLAEALELISTCQNEIRTLSYLLHPPMLDEAGLPSAIRWFADGFAKRASLRIIVSVAEAFEHLRLPSHIEMALFRVAQEAVSNVHRHTACDTARISLDFAAHDQPCHVRLEIADDGQGFPPAGWRCGVGVMGMSERVRQLGGDITFRRNQLGGASVTAIVRFRGG